jgi:hypothetical protein
VLLLTDVLPCCCSPMCCGVAAHRCAAVLLLTDVLPCCCSAD